MFYKYVTKNAIFRSISSQKVRTVQTKQNFGMLNLMYKTIILEDRVLCLACTVGET